MPDDPNQSTNYIPPSELPNEGSEPPKDRFQQQPPQENNQVIQEPTGEKTSAKDSFSSLIFIVLFYWILYLFINYYIRISNSQGFSNFPLPPSNPEGIDFLFLFIPIVGSVSSIVVFFIYKLLGSVKIILFIPAALLISIFILFSVGPRDCQGLGCLGYAYILMTLMYIVGSIYTSIFLNNIVLNLVRRYNHTLVILIIFSGITLITAFLLPKLSVFNFENRVIQNKEVKIIKTIFEKEEISGRIYRLNNGDSNRCCSILEKRPSGEFVLKKLDGNKFLVGGLVQENPGSDNYNYSNKYKADLYLEEEGKLINITKGLDFMPLYLNISSAGNGTRPVIISPSRERIAFFKRFISDPVLYVVNLDGSGVFMDENFCPMGWDCSRISWANDGYIYVSGEGRIRDMEEKKTFWKVTLP